MGSSYVPSNNAAARGVSHYVQGANGEKIQLVPGAPGYDLEKALPYLGGIASRGDKELMQALKDYNVYDQAMQGWGARYNDLVAEDLRNYAALAASRGISVPANMTEKNLQDYQNLLDQIEIEKQIADGRIKEAPQPLPSGNFTDVGPSVGPPGYQGSFFNLDSKMQEEYAELQRKYNDLVKNQSNTVSGSKTGGGSSGGTVGGVGVVDDGSSLNADVSSSMGAGTSGVVYGPDGTSYSSAAAAIAAGVPNFTFVKPVMANTVAGSSTADFTTPDNTRTGNINPGALITNANTQLFQINPTSRVRLPAGVTGY